MSSAAALPTKQADPQPGGWALPRAVPAAGTFYPTTRLQAPRHGGHRVCGGARHSGRRSPCPGVRVSRAPGISAVVVNVAAVAGRRRRGPVLRAGRRRQRPRHCSSRRRERRPLRPCSPCRSQRPAPSSCRHDRPRPWRSTWSASTPPTTPSSAARASPAGTSRSTSPASSTPTAPSRWAPAPGRSSTVDLGTAATPHTTALLVRATAPRPAGPGRARRSERRTPW